VYCNPNAGFASSGKNHETLRICLDGVKECNVFIGYVVWCGVVWCVVV